MPLQSPEGRVLPLVHRADFYLLSSASTWRRHMGIFCCMLLSGLQNMDR